MPPLYGCRLFFIMFYLSMTSFTFPSIAAGTRESFLFFSSSWGWQLCCGARCNRSAEVGVEETDVYIYFRTVALILLPMLLVYITFHDLRHFFDQEYSFPLGLPSILLSCPEFQLRLPPAAFLQAVSRQLRQCVDDRPSKPPPTLPSSLPRLNDSTINDSM